MINFSSLFSGSKTDYKGLLQNGAMLIDVRTPDEYRTGHVKGSVNIPLDTLPNRISELKSKNKSIIAVCRSGARSGAATSMLKKAGIEAYNGGGWDSFERQIR